MNSAGTRQPNGRTRASYGYDGWPVHGGTGQPSSISVLGSPPEPVSRLATARGRDQPGRGRDHERGAEHVQHDDGDGQAGEVLHEADGRLEHLDRGQRGDRAGVAAGAPAARTTSRRQADQQEHQVGVELAELQRVQPVARRARVAGVRARAGHDGAGVEDQPGDGVRRPAERRQHAPGGRGRRVVEAVQEEHGDGDDRQRQDRWSDTTHGLRSVSTVMPPSTAWAGIASPSTTDSRSRSRGRSGVPRRR